MNSVRAADKEINITQRYVKCGSDKIVQRKFHNNSPQQYQMYEIFSTESKKRLLKF